MLQNILFISDKKERKELLKNNSTPLSDIEIKYLESLNRMFDYDSSSIELEFNDNSREKL